MGTWDTGPFENDMAADFAYTLDETSQDKREALVRATLIRTIQTLDYLESPEGAEAVAAAALIAAQCPGGEPISTSYGPEEALPTSADALRPLAVEALDRVLADAMRDQGLEMRSARATGSASRCWPSARRPRSRPHTHRLVR